MSIKKRLDFIGIGVQKAGTTALHYYLSKHTSIEMSTIKELHYFDSAHLLDENKGDYENYHAPFNWNKGCIRGEITPVYLYLKTCMKDIYTYHPKVKLIIILRNPVERAYSHWNMRFYRKEIKASFRECINAELMRMKFRDYFGQQSKNDYLQRGLYSAQLENVYQFFSKNQILIIKYEDFKNDSFSVMMDIFKFLEVDNSIYKFEPKKVFTIPYENLILEEDKIFLQDFFISDIENIETMLNWNCTDWKL